MPTRMDNSIPDYMLAVPVTSGVNVSGVLIPLYGAIGFRADVWTQGGAAGNLALYTSTFDAAILPVTTIYPPQSGVISATVSANGTAFVGMHQNMVNTYARVAWITFIPNASGTIYVAVNVRRLSA